MRNNAHCAKMDELKNQDPWFLEMVFVARYKPTYTFAKVMDYKRL